MSEIAQIAPRSPFTGVRGWETVREEGALIALANTVPKNGVIVEIGSEFGMSAALWLKYARTAKVFCVEMNPNAPFIANVNEAGLGGAGAIRWIKENSRFVDFQALEIPLIDLLFVDGDHSYEGAYDDLMHYSPQVKTGGFMAVHDCACATNKNPHPLHHEVSSAVHHWLSSDKGKDWQFLFSVDTTMIFRKAEE